MTINMSSAFDTINMETVLKVLEDAGCTDVYLYKKLYYTNHKKPALANVLE